MRTVHKVMLRLTDCCNTISYRRPVIESRDNELTNINALKMAVEEDLGRGSTRGILY